ncbi:MAG: O-antigen ligase family protein [Firmicutes bacterium]|nr:O-antigen ligase family protein [Bacillota bacterium]
MLQRGTAPVPGAWLPAGSRWPLAAVVLAVLIGLLNPLAGLAAFLAASVWLAWVSLPLALGLYILLAPYPLGPVLHHHKFFATDMLALAMAAVLLWRVWRGGGFRAAWETFLTREYRAPLLLLLALSVLSLAVALSRFGTTVKILEYIEFFVVVVALFKVSGRDRSTWETYLYAFLLTAAVMVVYGTVQYLFALGPASNQIAGGYHVRATGLWGQPNVFGAFNEFLFPLVLGLLAFGPRDLKRGWLAAGLAVLAWGVVISYSRGAWVGDAAAVGFMGLAAIFTWRREPLARWLPRYAFWGVGVPVLAFLLVTGLNHLHLAHVYTPVTFHDRGASSRLLSTVTAVANPRSSYDTIQRLLIWKTALAALLSHPLLGTGLGNFHLYIAQHPPKGLVGGIPPMAHDLYLEWGADLGVGGILAALWLQWRWVTAPLKVLAGRYGALDRFWYGLGLGAFGTVVAFIVHDWVDFLIDHGVVVPLLLALGLIAALASGRREAERHEA